jgi:hypothetical protein
VIDEHSTGGFVKWAASNRVKRWFQVGCHTILVTSVSVSADSSHSTSGFVKRVASNRIKSWLGVTQRKEVVHCEARGCYVAQKVEDGKSLWTKMANIYI